MENISEKDLLQALRGRHGEEFVYRMQQAKVAVAGLGGIGSNVAIALVRMGIKHLHLIDFDKVDLCNLNRQQYVLTDVGKYKTSALREHLLKINPYAEIKTECLRLKADNIVEILADDDIICEALDVPEYKAQLVNSILESFPDKKVVAASGMAGVGSANNIVTKKINARLYICGDGTSDCAELPLTAARAAVCAAHQAHIICRIILGLE